MQLYIRDCVSSVTRPVKELKGFIKVALAPDERCVLSLTLTPRDFAYYDPAQAAWVTEPGDYDILIGASAGDIRLSRTLTLTRPLETQL